MAAANTEPMTPEQHAEALQRIKAFSEACNAQIDQEAQRGDEHTLDVTVQSHIPVLTFRYINTTIPLAVIEAEIHHLWYTVIQAAKYWHATNAKHDTLVRYILNARARGTLTRPLATIEAGGDSSSSSNSGSGRQEVIPCSDDGKFWSDLPLLGQDLVDEWTKRYYQANYSNNNDLRVNLAAFIGRLVSVGIYNGPAACAISLFRETLETTRPLVSTSVADAAASTDNKAEETVLSIDNLIHALQQLLVYAEGSIIVLSNDVGGAADDILPPHMSGLGELAIQSGLVSSPGFSPERWRFWIQRLEELARCEVEGIAGSAEVCLNYMRNASEAIYGPLAGTPRWLTNPSIVSDAATLQAAVSPSSI